MANCLRLWLQVQQRDLASAQKCQHTAQCVDVTCVGPLWSDSCCQDPNQAASALSEQCSAATFIDSLSAISDHVYEQQAGTTWRQSTHCLGASGTCTCTDACVDPQHFCRQQRPAGEMRHPLHSGKEAIAFRILPTCISTGSFKGRV